MLVPSSSRKNFLFYLLLVAVPFIAFWQIGLMQNTMKWDMLDQFFPYRYFLSECLDTRIVPAWNPYQHLGAPFHADPQSGFWYPVAWLLALTRDYDIYTMNFEFILHICVAGIGFFTLLKGFEIESETALLFSFAFQCCGVFVNNAQHLTWIVALAWLPFVVHHYFRILETGKIQHAVATAFFMLLMLTGGYPIFTVITNYFLGAVFLLQIFKSVKEKNWQQVKNITSLNALMYLVFVILASGYLTSFWKALPYISRGAGLTLEKAMEGALPVKALVSLLFPFATTKNEGVFLTDLSMLNVYIGLVPLLFAGASIFYLSISRVRLFAIFGIICLLAALGDATPVREMFYHYLPAMDKFRFPSIFRAFFLFSFLIAAAISFQKSIERWASLKKYFLSALVLLAIAVIGTHFYVLEKANHFVKFPSLFNVQDYLAFFERSNLQQRIAIQSLIQFALLLLLIVVFWRMRNQSKLVIALIFITVADLFLSVQFNLPATAISEVRADSFQKQLDEMPKEFPIPALFPILEVPAYDKRLSPSWYNQNIFTKQPSHHGFNSFQLTDYANFYDSPTRDSVLKHPIVFLEPALQDQEIRLTKFEPGRMEVSVSSEKNSRLTLLQSSYPGWLATIDGVPTNFEKIEIPFLSVAVSQGNHFIQFKYAPAYLIPAMFIAGIGFFLVMIYLAVGYFRS